jgi:hypothetical protein
MSCGAKATSSSSARTGGGEEEVNDADALLVRRPHNLSDLPELVGRLHALRDLVFPLELAAQVDDKTLLLALRG